MSEQQLRDHLHRLTAELGALGVGTLAYDPKFIDHYTFANLESCIDWAEGLIEHILEVRRRDVLEVVRRG
jgi:hypothetical protein